MRERRKNNEKNFYLVKVGEKMKKSAKINETQLNRDYQFIKELIERCKNNDGEACKMMYQYFKLVIDKGIKDAKYAIGSSHKDDIKSVAFEGICRATLSYKGSSSDQYFNYVNLRIKSRIIDYIKRESKHIYSAAASEDSFDHEQIPDSFNCENHCIQNIIKEQLYSLLNHKEKKLYSLISEGTLSNEDISKHLNISNDCFRQRKVRLILKIREIAKNKGIILNFN
jgi:RNA polymerase sigma factor (sigma-70 family)